MTDTNQALRNKLGAALICHPNAVRPLIEEALQLLEDAALAQPAQAARRTSFDVTLDGEPAGLLRAMLGEDEGEPPTPIRLLVGDGHSGHGLYVAQAEYQDEGAVLLCPVEARPPQPEAQPAATPEQGTGADLTAAMLLMNDVRNAATNGEALGAVLAYRKAVRSEALAQQPAPSATDIEKVINWLRNNYQDHTIDSLCEELQAQWFERQFDAVPAPSAEAPDEALLMEIDYAVHHGWPRESWGRLERIAARIKKQRTTPSTGGDK